MCTHQGQQSPKPQIKDEIEDLVQVVSHKGVTFPVPQIKDESEDLIQLVSQQAVTCWCRRSKMKSRI